MVNQVSSLRDFASENNTKIENRKSFEKKNILDTFAHY